MFRELDKSQSFPEMERRILLEGGGPEAIKGSVEQFQALRDGVIDLNFNYCTEHEDLVPEYHLMELWQMLLETLLLLELLEE